MPGIRTVLDGQVVSDTRSLEDARAEAAERVAEGFELTLAAGMPWQGRVLQIDDESRANLSGAALRAQLGTLPTGFAWRMADNSFLPLDAAGVIAMAAATMDHYLALRRRMWAARDAARAAPSREAADAISF